MKYRFYLYHADQGKYIRIKDPVGWNSLGKTIKRDMTWHGIFFDYAPKLKFVKDGKSFIQFYYEKYGIETTILLKIERQDPLTRVFEVDYIGRLNLTKYRISTIYVECNVESDSSMLQTIKNKENVKIALTGLTSMTLHSKIIPKNFKGSFKSTTGFSYPLVSAGDFLQFTYDEDDSDIEQLFDYPPDKRADIPFEWIRPKEAGTYSFDLKIFSRTTGAINDIKWYLRINSTDHEFTRTSYAAVGGLPLLLVYHVLTLDDEPIDVDDKIYLYGEVIVGASISFQIFPASLAASIATTPGDLPAGVDTAGTVSALTSTASSTANMGLKFENFTQVLQGITGKADSFRSSYYGRTENGYGSDGAGSLRANTNGLQLRGINKPVHLTLKELITTAQAIDGLGFGIIKSAGVERLYAEPLTFWYQAKRLMRLDYVKDIEKEVLEELYYNEIEAGPDKWSTTAGNVSNLDEFNARKEWTLPITQLKKKLLLKSPYLTGGYALEFTRRENKEPTKNTELDNNIFEIELRRNSGFEPAKDQLFSSVTGVISPATAYNLNLSPGRCIRRNGRLIRAAMEKQREESIAFSFGEANSAMYSKLTAEATGITENANILISDLDKPLFLAEAYSIRAKLTRQQLIDLNTTDPAAAANVWQFVEFSDTNKNYKRGYVMQARPSPDSNECEMILLRANI